MKIIHTADWHIGKRLHKHDLVADFGLFVTWLHTLVQDRQVDALLVSGDVFDLANPSSEARTAYYKALAAFNGLDCQLIITGGNHDSPAMLNAPRELLSRFHIHVVGSMPANPADYLVPIGVRNGAPEVVVAAIPFLRDADLRVAVPDQSYEDRLEAVREGIAHTFAQAAEQCERLYPSIPAVAMGHLFATGAVTSDGEREIQVGNLASFDAQQFTDYFRYVALGHIHKPQRVNAPMPVLYSGSPYPLSFSEREDRKRVLLIDTEKGWEPEVIEVPSFRQLRKVSGTLDELSLQLNMVPPGNNLPTLVELEMVEEHADPGKIERLEHLVRNFEREGVVVVKYHATALNRIKGAAEIYQAGEELKDLQPRDVFIQLLDQHQLEADDRVLLFEAFEEILEEVLREENQEQP